MSLFLFIFFILYVENANGINDNPSTKITSICAGGLHTCAVFGGKRMKCWGSLYSWGRALDDKFGNPSEIGDKLPFVYVGEDVNIEQVDCGSRFTCLRFNTGQVKCLGKNDFGQIGIGNSTIVIGSINGFIGENLPTVMIGSGLNATYIALGAAHLCILVAGNSVKCIGKNDSGQLGQGDTMQRGTNSSLLGDQLPFIDFGTSVEISSIYSGSSAMHTCVMLSAPTNVTQRIKCWGEGKMYKLGYGNSTRNIGDNINEMGDFLPLLDLGIESRVKQLALGDSHTCALLLNDALKCWGQGNYGKLGSGASRDVFATGEALSIVQVNSGKVVKFVTAGYAHTCIVYDDLYTMKCVGANARGQLGVGDKLERGDKPSSKIPNLDPIQLGADFLPILFLRSGASFNCVVFIDSRVKCFGAGDLGQLANGRDVDIGDNGNEMGLRLPFVMLFSPTTSPSSNPTKSSTLSPRTNISEPITNSPTPFKAQSQSNDLAIALGVSIPIVVIGFFCFGYYRYPRKTKNKKQKRHTSAPPPAPTLPSASSLRLEGDIAQSKSYIAFLSHCKNETGPTATMLYKDITKYYIEKEIETKDIFIDNEHLTDLHGLPDKVNESLVMVALLSKSYLSRPWCLIELYYAIKYSIPIITVNVVGSGYDFEHAKSFLENLCEENLEKINTGASAEFRKLNIDLRELGHKLANTLPQIIANEYNPNTGTRIRDAQLGVIADQILLNAKQRIQSLKISSAIIEI